MLQVGNTGPRLWVGFSECLENLIDLVRLERVAVISFSCLLLALEQWLAGNELCKDATDSPQVDGLGVVLGACVKTVKMTTV